MHEYSIVAALVERAEEEAKQAGAITIGRIQVQIGDLAGVERELFRTAFDTFKHGICASTALDIVRTAGDGDRPRASRNGGALMCGTCGCGDPELVNGEASGASRGAVASGMPVSVDVHESLLTGNDQRAAHLRQHFAEDGVTALNLMGSPGSGKTSLLEPPPSPCGAAIGWRRSRAIWPPTVTAPGCVRPACPP